MSSELDGLVAVGAGVALLGAGAALVGVVGAGWLLYNTGRLAINAVSGIGDAAAERGRQLRLEKELRQERAQRARARVDGLCATFIKETQAELKKISDPEVARRMETLLKRAKAIAAGGTGSLEGRNAADIAELDELVRVKNQLLAEARLPASTMGQAELSRVMAEIQCELRAAIAAGETVGVDVAAMDPEQFERLGLREEFNGAVVRIRAALEEEDRRAKAFPVSEKSVKTLHRLFDGIVERVAALNDPDVTNDALKNGLKRLNQILESYELMTVGLREEEAEFMTLYPVYKEVMTGLNQEVKAIHELKGLAELKAELERSKAMVERAQICAQLLRNMGEDAYMVLAFDTEMQAMGYQVVDSRRLMDQMKTQLHNHVCNADTAPVALPVYDMPDGKGITQMYTVDESCRLQVIVREDGTTTLHTIMQGADEEKTKQAQKFHCARAAELRKRLRENWFLISNLEEIAPAEAVTTQAVGEALDPAARMTGDHAAAGAKTMEAK